MLAILTPVPANRSPQMFEELHRLFWRAKRCTDRGMPIEELICLAQPAPPGRFRIDIPSLCWASVARLREALEQCVAAFENDLRQLITALHRHQLTWDESAARCAGLFAAADAAIGEELSEIAGAGGDEPSWAA